MNKDTDIDYCYLYMRNNQVFGNYVPNIIIPQMNEEDCVIIGTDGTIGCYSGVDLNLWGYETDKLMSNPNIIFNKIKEYHEKNNNNYRVCTMDSKTSTINTR